MSLEAFPAAQLFAAFSRHHEPHAAALTFEYFLFSRHTHHCRDESTMMMRHAFPPLHLFYLTLCRQPYHERHGTMQKQALDAFIFIFHLTSLPLPYQEIELQALSLRHSLIYHFLLAFTATRHASFHDEMS